MPNTSLQCTLTLDKRGIPVLSIPSSTTADPRLISRVAAWLKAGEVTGGLHCVAAGNNIPGFVPASSNVYVADGSVWVPTQTYGALTTEVGMASHKAPLSKALRIVDYFEFGIADFPHNLSLIASKVHGPGFPSWYVDQPNGGQGGVDLLVQFIDALESHNILPPPGN